jgi:hypothetical protein
LELLWHFASGIQPLSIAALVIKWLGVSKVSRDLVSTLESGCCAEGLELSLVNHAMQFLLALGNPTESFPSINVQEIVISCINGTGDGIISSND